MLIEFDLTTGTQLRTIDVPRPLTGIAHDAGQLFVSDGQSVDRVDPATWVWTHVSGGPPAAADGLLFDAAAVRGWQWNTIVTSSGMRGVLREFDPARNAFSGPAAVHGYPGMPATLLPGSLSGGELWRDPLTGARHAVLLIVDTVVTCRLDARTGPECGDRFTLAPVVLGGEIRCEYQTPRSSVALFAAFGPGNISLPVLPAGCAVHLDPATLVWLAFDGVPVNGMGSLAIPVVVPPNLLDVPVWFQAVTLDGSGLGATQGHVAAVKVR